MLICIRDAAAILHVSRVLCTWGLYWTATKNGSGGKIENNVKNGTRAERIKIIIFIRFVLGSLIPAS